MVCPPERMPWRRLREVGKDGGDAPISRHLALPRLASSIRFTRLVRSSLLMIQQAIPSIRTVRKTTSASACKHDLYPGKGLGCRAGSLHNCQYAVAMWAGAARECSTQSGDRINSGRLAAQAEDLANLGMVLGPGRPRRERVDSSPRAPRRKRP
jgi:hypothetical protein